MTKTIAKIAALICAAVMVLAVLAGCYGSNTQVNDQSKAYRTYMSQVNQIMVELDEGLDAFTDAVSRNDTVNMGSALDQALKTLDKLDGLEVPAALKDVHKDYVDAAATLEGALRDYAALYAEIDAAAEGDKADWDDYEDRISQIQAQYDEGVQGLKDADEAAAKAGTF